MRTTILSGVHRKVARGLWDAQRFGLTPEKWVARITNHHEPKIAIISVPKAGTHLLERVLCLHPRLYRRWLPTIHPGNVERYGGLQQICDRMRPGEVLVTHLHYAPALADLLSDRGIKVLVVVRDPRDIVVSKAFYISSSPKHPYYPFAKDLSLAERLKRAIVGDPERGLPSIADTLSWFMDWLELGHLVVRFEELHDPQKRLTRTEQLFEGLQLAVTPQQLRSICDRAVSAVSPTFRRGTSGGWSQYFDDRLSDLFMQTAGHLMVRYGYAVEQDIR